MDLVFADDARQPNPTRQGMEAELVAIGGVHVTGTVAGALERKLAHLCKKWGFDVADRFKWSPTKNDQVMRNLVGDDRARFFGEIVACARELEATATVAIVDTKYRRAMAQSSDHETDVTTLFLERVNNALVRSGQDGLVVVAKPSGGKREENTFLARCAELVINGTPYSSFTRLPFKVLSAPSRNMRCLQLADVVASCVLSRVAGESQHSPPVFESIHPLLRTDDGRIGGVGLKIHPDFRYRNLYHWLLGDQTFGGQNEPLPSSSRAYSESPGE